MRLACLVLAASIAGGGAVGAQRDDPLRRSLAAAVDYLAVEVPSWEKDNGCYSCHNNGDGARALYRARRAGWEVPDESLAATTRWLTKPGDWATQKGEPGVRDLRLAQIQFSAALKAAVEAGMAPRSRLVEAARGLLPFQSGEGSWASATETLVGSPATYGAVLATLMAHQVVGEVEGSEAEAAAARAAGWLLAGEHSSTLDRAVSLMALQRLDPASDRRADLIAQLIESQGSTGGWGPYPGAPPEVFDTALALMALAGEEGAGNPLERGAEFLVSRQLPAGGWLETTRPSGGESYAQHVSTSAWATLALLAVSAERDLPRR